MSVHTVELSDMQEIESAGASLLNNNFEVIKNVKVKLQVSIGGAEISVSELMSLSKDSVVKLDREANAPVDLILDGKLVARGILVAADDNFGVQITEINH